MPKRLGMTRRVALRLRISDCMLIIEHSDAPRGCRAGDTAGRIRGKAFGEKRAVPGARARGARARSWTEGSAWNP